MTFDRALGEEPDPAWTGQIDQLLVRGRYLTEAVFFHRASRSLILTDLVQNFEAGKIGSFWLGLAMRLAGCLHPDGAMPRDLRLTFLGHRGAFRRAVARMLAWQPERVIIAHGRWYAEHGARGAEAGLPLARAARLRGGPAQVASSTAQRNWRVRSFSGSAKSCSGAPCSAILPW